MKEIKSIILENEPQVAVAQLYAKVAVHLHAFYLDLLPEYADRLRNIPVAFDLFVSVPDCVEADDEGIRKPFDKIPLLQKLQICHTPNCGRDIGPMLCTFAEELTHYDILLHLHTKKSPQDPASANWRTFILEHLLHSPEAVAVLLLRLQENVGIIAAPNYIINSPDGWTHALNKTKAQEWIDKHHLDINLEADYPCVQYPQGTMFWCNTRYLKPIFDLHLSYDDFEPEPLPVDGSVAHALERLFFVLGKDSGMHPAYVHLTQASALHSDYIEAYAKVYVSRLLHLEKKTRAHRRLIKTLAGLCLICIIIIIALLCFL